MFARACCLLLAAAASGSCRILPSIDEVMQETREAAARKLRTFADDASFDEVEHMHNLFLEAGANTQELLRVQRKIAESIDERIPCQATASTKADKTIPSMHPWTFSDAKKVYMHDDAARAIGLPQRLLLMPSFLDQHEASSMAQAAPLKEL